tara:strand:+ start:530 stop:1978 length:1449 start_codon:yes stop_codon:yes gene_type:complete
MIRHGFKSCTDLAYNLYLDLVDIGFDLVLWRKYGERLDNTQLINPIEMQTPPDVNVAALYLLSASNKIDAFSVVEHWELLIEAHPRYLKIWVLTPDSYSIDEYGVLVVKDMPSYTRFTDLDGESDETKHYQYGYLAQGFYKEGTKFKSFLDFREDTANWDIDYSELEGNPLTYVLSKDNAGIFVGISAEPQENYGNRFAWFAVSRLTNAEGKVKREHVKRPVWCLFSLDGGGGSVLNPKGIQQFCVRESDIHLPTDKTSAVLPSNRFNAVINPIEQTSLGFDGTTVIEKVQGFSNFRFRYALTPFMPILAFASADVHEATEQLKESFPDGDVVYTAWLANGPHSTGMRLYYGSSDREVGEANYYFIQLSEFTVVAEDVGREYHLNITVRDSLLGSFKPVDTELFFTLDVMETDFIYGDDPEQHDGILIPPVTGSNSISPGLYSATVRFKEHRPSEFKGKRFTVRLSFPTLHYVNDVYRDIFV